MKIEIATSIDELDLTKWDTRRIAYLAAAVSVVVSVVLSLHLIYKHLRNYTRPKLQRCIVRIILMVPIYSLCSWFSLMYLDHASIIDLFRDCYEAFLLYQFFVLIVAFINEYEDEHQDEEDRQADSYYDEEEEDEFVRQQEKMPLKGAPASPDMKFIGSHLVWADEERVIHVLKSKPPMKLGDGCGPCFTCKCGFFGPGRKFLKWTKRCIMQFVIMKPLLALSVIVMEWFEVYHEGSFSPKAGYFWVVVTQNVCITLAMYALVLFYHAVAKELHPFKPIPKFLCIKAIIGFAFWQSVIISICVHFEWLKGNDTFSVEELAVALQDWLICMEMLGIAIAHIFIFGHESYRDHTKEIFIRAPIKSLNSFAANLFDVVLIKDVILEVVTAFDPRVKDKRTLRSEREKIEKSIAAAQEPAEPYPYYTEEAEEEHGRPQQQQPPPSHHY
jgi:hypothetical protein